MNSSKVRYSCFVVCLAVLLGSTWSGPAGAAGEILLKSEKFTLAPPEAPTTTVPFQLGGPGTVILEITTAQPLEKFGIVARGAYPKAASFRKDGPTGRAPLRMEIKVTSQDLQKGTTWLAFPTLVGPNRSLYSTPGAMVAGELKISFIPAPGSQQAAQPPQAVPQSVGTMSPAANIAALPLPAAKPQRGTVPQKGVPVAAAATLPNPSGFTATAGAGGDVILKWSPVPNAISYNLQGPGVTVPGRMPPNISGTTHTVKGLAAGTHSWVLFAVYSGPSGPFWGDESNPAKASMTISGKEGWYKFSLTGFQVRSQTYDDFLNVDGWGDEVYITMDVVETGPAGKVIQPSGQLPADGNFGDTGRAENKTRAGTASSKGGLKNADVYNGAPFPYRVWCGQLVQGQTAVAITSTIWEWDPVAGASFGEWMAFIAKHNKDLQSADVQKAGAAMNANFGLFMQSGAVLTEAGAKGLLKMIEVTGTPGTRPIGIAQDGTFTPRTFILTYDIAEQALSRVWHGDPIGTLSIRYQETHDTKLNGDYTLKSRVERIAGPQVCQQWP